MPETFRFSPRPNRAAEVRWRVWGRDALDEAARADRPVLLNLTAVWCHWCHVMDETTYSEPAIIELINERLVPVRVDADRYPHVQDRYIAGGWPTNAFLTPTGEVLWAGTYVPPEQFREVADAVLGAWHGRRTELQAEIERRRMALEAARSRHPSIGLVRREAADDVLTAAQDTFDPRNGGFGSAPKFPHVDAIELLFVQGHRTANSEWVAMAERTLDGMLAGELWDAVEGGFFRYATEADWTEPHFEKMLDVNAGLVEAYALGAALLGREDWRETVERTIAWADRVLRQEHGLWGGSQDADERYYRLDAAERQSAASPFVDPVIYAGWNARWIRALAEAGGRLDRPDWIEAAAVALDRLLDEFTAPGDLIHHYRAPGEAPDLPGLLADAVAAGRACVSVAQATGRRAFIDHARRIASGMKRALWADDGGFFDHVRTAADVGALRYRDRPFDTNAEAARLNTDLALESGEPSARAMAERTLAPLSPLAGRYGVGAAGFALAVEEFFEPPLRLVVVGPVAAAEPLRRHALALQVPTRRVWTMEAGGRIGPVRFAAVDGAAVYACGSRSCSPPIRDPARLASAVESID